MIFLDTHSIVWHYQFGLDHFLEKATNAILENRLYYSPVVRVELEL